MGSGHEEIHGDLWRRIGTFLSGPTSSLIGDPQRSELLVEWSTVSRLEDHLDDALLVGLVGGTGVGKSMLINAFAGAEISQSSDRRPTTHRIVAYLHQATRLPAQIPDADFAVPDVRHQLDRISKVILLDFPDFDSDERSHAEVLRKMEPHLDVLLVVVDDMKYADLRLYEFLRHVDQATTNVFFVLNKVDRLQTRYPGREMQVAQEILQDLRNKLAQHIHLTIPPEQCYTISARNALLQAKENPRGPEEPSPHATPLGVPEFEKLLALVFGFQAEERRRLIKEQNLDLRKQRLCEDFQSAVLSDTNRRHATRLAETAAKIEPELERVLRGIPTEIFGERERRLFRGSELRRAGVAWGGPVALAFTLLDEFGRWRGKTLAPTKDLAARAMRHYRSYFDALRNLESRCQIELEDDSLPDDRAAVAAALASDAAKNEVRQTIRERAAELAEFAAPQSWFFRRFGRWTAHLPAVACLGLAVAMKLPQWHESGQGPGITGWLGFLVGLLNPFFLLNVLLAVAGTYLLTAAAIWLRTIQRLESRLTEFEQTTRGLVTDTTKPAADRLRRRLLAFVDEFREVNEWLPVASDALEASPRHPSP